MFDIAIDQSNRRFGLDGNGRNDNFKRALAQLIKSQKRFILPSQQHIANTTANKGGR